MRVGVVRADDVDLIDELAGDVGVKVRGRGDHATVAHQGTDAAYDLGLGIGVVRRLQRSVEGQEDAVQRCMLLDLSE